MSQYGLLVDAGRLWAARLFKDPGSHNSILDCAVGNGDATFTDPENPPAEQVDQVALLDEFARVQSYKKEFLIEDSDGPIQIDNKNYAEVDSPVVGDPAADSGNAGDDTAASGGTYTGDENDTYTIGITTGGAPGTAQITVTSLYGDGSGPHTVTAFGTPVSIGSKGATISFTDGSDGVLTVGDKWKIVCYVTTNILAFFFRFLEAQANAEIIKEYGFFADTCEFLSAAIGTAAADSGNTGDDTATSGGTYTGTQNQTYTVEVTTGGAPGTAQITVTSTKGDGSGPHTVTAFGTPIAIGSNGVTISFADGGDTVLTLGDKWTIACTKSVSGNYAENGVYHPTDNEDGEVKEPGLLYEVKNIPDYQKQATDTLELICAVQF